MALVGQSYDDAHRHKALGKVMGLMFLGGASATAIGGALAYFGSWRVVYIAYGAAELIAALLMLKLLQRDTPVISTLNYVKAYREPLGNPKFMRIVLTIFFVGFSVFGTFTYSGKLLQQLTGYDVLGVGLILSLFGLGTVLGGRLAPKLKQRTGARYFILTAFSDLFRCMPSRQAAPYIFLSPDVFSSASRLSFCNRRWSRRRRKHFQRQEGPPCPWHRSICLWAEPSARESTQRSSAHPAFRPFT
jgi:predicted MFS family arabinose efflux permease